MYCIYISVFCLCTYLYCSVVILLFCDILLFYIVFIFVCTSVGLLPPGESPIVVIIIIIIIIITDIILMYDVT